MSHRFPSARLLAAGGISAALFAPGAAHAAQGEIGCANIEVLVTRGSSEPANSSIALDAGTNINSETGVWSMIRKEFQTPTDGSTPIADQRIVDYTGDGVLDPGQIVRTDVDYPADLPFPNAHRGEFAESDVFERSVRLGTKRIIEHLNDQSSPAKCPQKRYVLLGYSQGAVVVGNVLSPVASRLWIDKEIVLPALSEAAKGKIVAVGLFADVGFNREYGWAEHAPTLFGADAPPYLRNTADDKNRGVNDGNSSRISTVSKPRALTAFDEHKGKIRDYCIQNDFVCQGSGGLAEHLYYGDPAQPAPRRNLSIFVTQKLRNQVDKTLTASCMATVASAPGQQGTPFTAKFRFQATVNDRGVAGTPTSITSPRATFSLDATNASKLKTILGGATSVNTTLTQTPMTGLPTDSSGSTGTAALRTWGASITTPKPFTSGSAWSASTTSSALPTWTLGANGRLDLALSSAVLIVAGDNGEFARSECSLPTTNQFSSFGRVVVS